MQRQLDGDVRRVGLVVAASAVVATAAAGVGLLGAPVALSPGWIRGLQLLGVGAVTVGVVGLVLDRPRSVRRGPDPTMTSLFATAIIMCTLAFAAWLAPRTDFGRAGQGAGASANEGNGMRGSMQREELPPPPPPTAPIELNEGFLPEGIPLPTPGREETRAAPRAEQEPLSWGLLSEFGELFVVLLVGLLIVAGWAVRKPRSEAEPEESPEEELTPRQALAAFEASIEALAASEVEDRELIAVAYRRLLSALAIVGLDRAPHEAPLEHIARAVRRLGLGMGAMRRLARLFVAARFGGGPVSEAHRRAATQALSDSLTELRAFLDRDDRPVLG